MSVFDWLKEAVGQVSGFLSSPIPMTPFGYTPQIANFVYDWYTTNLPELYDIAVERQANPELQGTPIEGYDFWNSIFSSAKKATGTDAISLSKDIGTLLLLAIGGVIIIRNI